MRPLRIFFSSESQSFALPSCGYGADAADAEKPFEKGRAPSRRANSSGDSLFQWCSPAQ